MNNSRIINKLLDVKKSTDVEKIIDEIGNKIKWIPVGNNPNNYGIISMGAHPYDGITERITNSIDAMIELNVELNSSISKMSSPREAIEMIHSIKQGILKNADNKTISSLASDIKVKFFNSGKPKAPTILVWDKGIGQHPDDFPETLLSLNSDYKAIKFYLIGAFGQGGQTSFNYCDYCIIISRKNNKLLKKRQKDEIGWSIVRFHDPSTDKIFYKRGLWEYCVDANTGKIFTSTEKDIRVAFNHGTYIKLVTYDLPKGSSDVLQPSGTAWSYLSQSLFDPVLPIRLFEERSPKFEKRNRPLSGLATRLWKGGRGENVKLFNNSYEVDLGKKGKVNINYWTMDPASDAGGKSKWRDVKKGYVTGKSAVFLTLNGQRHGIENSLFLRDKVNLKYSFDYVIVQVDCDNLTKIAKKQLLSSTRERLREGEMKDILFKEVAIHLQEDRNLLAFEKERKNKIMTAETEKDTTKIRKMVSKIITSNPQLSELIMKEGKEDSPSKKQRKSEKKPDEDKIADEELVTPELKPIPTYLIVTNKKNPIPVEKGGSALIRLETDAEDDYLEGENENRFRIIHTENKMKKKSKSKLRNGKLSYHVTCPSSIRVGSSEIIKIQLDRPNEAPFEIEKKLGTSFY